MIKKLRKIHLVGMLWGVAIISGVFASITMWFFPLCLAIVSFLVAIAFTGSYLVDVWDRLE